MSSTRPAATLAPFHSSTRTALSQNIDPTTGQRLQVMTTSRLELCWLAGELRIDCKTSRVVMDAPTTKQRPARWARGAL